MPTPVLQYADEASLSKAINPSALTGVDSPTKLAAIDGASRQIDSFLRAKFKLPLVLVGADIRKACIDIAIYDVMVGRGYNPEAGADPGIKDRMDAAFKWLKLISEGKAVPDVTDSSPAAAEGRPGARPIIISASSRGFSNRGSASRRGPFQSD